MYDVIGTGSITILLYLISYFFSRTGYYSPQFHRNIWNILLAVAFSITALAGLFMALQISYKWDIPFIKSVLKWHVEFGIGMALTGIFHFIYHLSYFLKLFERKNNKPVNSFIEINPVKDIGINLFITGFVSSSFQLLLIREMMNISGGYELITGTFLGSWLIGSAIGAALAGKSQLNDLRKINLIFSLSPVISLILMFIFSRLFLSTGETPSFLVSMLCTLIILIPYCLVSGFTFIKLISAAGTSRNFIPGKSFSIETAGGIASGIIITILTSGLLNTYKLLLLIVLLSVGYVLLNFIITSQSMKFLTKVLIILLASCIIIVSPDIFFRQILLPGIEVTDSEDTPYGNITYGTYRGEESLYYNHRLISFKDDVIEREENIHYAMLQIESPDKVILISGSLSSHLPEIFKYPVKKIVYIQRDPELAKSEEAFSNIYQGKVEISNSDAFRYIRKSHEPADVTLLLIPPPSTLLLNRYYTTEFFSEVKKNLTDNGIFMCTPGPGDSYFNKESLNLYSSVYNSLSAVFRNVVPIIGNKLYFIASDKQLSVSFCQLASIRNIKNLYVSPDFLSDDLIQKKSGEVLSLMDRGIKQNRSAFPVACFHFQAYAFSRDIDEKIPAIIIMIMVFAVPVLMVKRRNLLMYCSAAALAGFEIIILLTLQLVAGNMYQLTGLIIAGIMTGLAVGTGARIRLLDSFSLSLKGIFLLLFYIFIGLIYNYIIEMNSSILSVSIIVISVFIPSLITGNFFRQLTMSKEDSLRTSAIYSADLAGSALGFILMSGLAIPVLGIQISIFSLSLLIFTGILFGTVMNK